MLRHFAHLLDLEVLAGHLRYIGAVRYAHSPFILASIFMPNE